MFLTLETIESDLLPITLDETSVLPFSPSEWQDREIELTLDSGCCEHVLDIVDVPGYANFIVESTGSRRGQNFVVGNGERVPNEGQVMLNMENGDGIPLQSTFQVAEITRPLLSVGRVCDQGLNCVFKKDEALVCDADGNTVCRFARAGGLYIARLKLKSPELFARQVR